MVSKLHHQKTESKQKPLKNGIVGKRSFPFGALSLFNQRRTVRFRDGTTIYTPLLLLCVVLSWCLPFETKTHTCELCRKNPCCSFRSRDSFQYILRSRSRVSLIGHPPWRPGFPWNFCFPRHTEASCSMLSRTLTEELALDHFSRARGSI